MEPSIVRASSRRGLSDEVRASLEAVRKAQEKAQQQARRQTLHARIWLTALMVVAALAIVGSRATRSRHARTQAAAPVQPAHASPQPQAAPSAEAARPAAAPEPALALPSEAVAHVAVAARASAEAVASSDEGCDATVMQSTPWRLSPEACARAFAGDPSNARLALAVAQAEHARGRIAEAAAWAKQALAIDPATAEAYVIVARAEAQDGHRDGARQAYRRYLKLAPRGWHQAEARAALRPSRSS